VRQWSFCPLTDQPDERTVAMADSTPPTPEVQISSVNPAASEMRVAAPEPHAPVAPVTPPAPRPVATVLPATAPAPGHDFEAYMDEFASSVAGSLSPFGDDVEFPLPIERLGYVHPRPVNRPALAGD
jgi:succinate dehydrogenase / fumarate reductase, iron-sulfur subunit